MRPAGRGTDSNLHPRGTGSVTNPKTMAPANVRCIVNRRTEVHLIESKHTLTPHGAQNGGRYNLFLFA